MSTRDASKHEEGEVLLERIDGVAILTLSRPEALNALTWKMYEQLAEHLSRLANDETLRVVVLYGEGKAFAAGTDIAQFQGFSAKDGVAYEHKMEAIVEQLYNFPRPVLAAIHGYAVGAGLVLAAVADLRYATPSARFGAPIARTLGNCLSLKNYQHLVAGFGAMRAKEMLFTARLLSAEEALQAGFLTNIIAENDIYTHVAGIARQISALAPLTIWATREAQRRLDNAAGNVHYDDVIARLYGSQDFAEGVRAYLEKRKPTWNGS
ncbi:enoyl-CoA hydratase [Ktedonosporobacter rubrisoli]|uniref:Enoyl-CoA hydratase n=1 Tax=Ktedonosporobacter rubrisoli TaxID=2509675 RepID=A0A4P6JZ75_KTERU|nr:enoyl-CoA hydratase [Ktedonosporobacter rubrisoli]QBD80895.1 enoyl-CoA hydratase [Ktedonosporobacter rubrisoli]